MHRGSGGDVQESEGNTSARDPDFAYRSEEEPEHDDDSSHEEFAPQELFNDWMLSLRLDQRKMLSVILMETFKSRIKMNAKDAATEAGSVVGFNEKTVRRYRNDFFENKGEFTIQQQGKYERHCVYHDEALNHKAAEWVREHAFVKGEPNMTSQSFCDWVNKDLLPSSPHFPRSISLRTAVRWLHHLGFKPVSHKKGVYIDGHEREDVVRHRKSLLKALHDLCAAHKPPPPCSDEPTRIRKEEDENRKELVVIYHDESIFNTNEGQTWMWGEEERPAIWCRQGGLLDGRALHGAERWILQISNMEDGGPQRVRGTVWGRKPQSMVNKDGTAKGLRTILGERGMNTEGMLADDMWVVLSNHEDFANEKTILEHYLHERGHSIQSRESGPKPKSTAEHTLFSHW
jgi:hypothetical protein